MRADALAILRAGVASVEPRALVRDHLTELAGALPAKRIWIAAVGKAAVPMAAGAVEVLGDRVAGGVIVAAPGTPDDTPGGLRLFEGGHPIPDATGVAGAEAAHDLAVELTADDLLLGLISGGGSALMTLPPAGIELGDLQTATDELLRAGATIEELNTVRKHLDRLKGGRLAAAAAPARVLALVLSDVVGDPLDVIASGPVSPDPRTFSDAWQAIERLGVASALPESVRRHLESGLAGAVPESPKPGDACFERVDARVIGSNRLAAAAALAIAEERGFATRLLTTEQVGEAKAVGAELAGLGRAIVDGAHEQKPPACLLAAGETTVKVTGNGRGGRNQELVLGAALVLADTERVLVASMGTDGIDGPTEAAGAWADGRTRARAAAVGIELEESLGRNDSHTVFARLDDLIVTGPTGTNVMDLMLVLIAAG